MHKGLSSLLLAGVMGALISTPVLAAHHGDTNDKKADKQQFQEEPKALKQEQHELHQQHSEMKGDQSELHEQHREMMEEQKEHHQQYKDDRSEAKGGQGMGNQKNDE